MPQIDYGLVRGKSAYESAKYNGFTGTEAEWVERLTLPDVTTADNGKILQVVGGKWAASELTDGDALSYGG